MTPWFFQVSNLRWSWRELDRHVSHVAAALLALGVEPGEHIGIWSMNVPEWVVTQFAAGKIGAVLVNVNPAYRVHELRDALTMADVVTLVVGSPFKGSNFVAMVETLCPQVATATGRDWWAPLFPRLKRLIALGTAPVRHGTTGRTSKRGRSRPSPNSSLVRAPLRRPMCTTSSLRRAQPVCPKGQC